MKFDFKNTIRRINKTAKGRERTMYTPLNDLFVHVLGHSPENIIIDSPQKDAGGNSPDLAIRCDTGIVDAKGIIYHDWIVVEAKDEKDAFLDIDQREEIFKDKQKYIRPETEWFVMVDPNCIIIRPIAVRHQITADNDKVFLWEDFSSADDFCKKLADLHAENAADSPALKDFRNGDESRIAVVKVDVSDAQRAKLSDEECERLALAKKDFLHVIYFGTKILQAACQQALEDWDEKIKSIETEVEKFDKNWGGYELTFDKLLIKGKNKIISAEQKQAHDSQSLALKKKIKQNIAIAKLAIFALPDYRKRSSNGSDEPFATESANLILVRVLLLRFFEDHNFFGNKKYVCNGGVEALQKFMSHHDKGYAVVLRAAYEKGGEIYGETFDETDLDWVLNSPSKPISRAIELTMMLLSRFDFSTISGDILTGIYDRFLDKAQRKAMGEFYTPPSIARYIIRRLEIRKTDSIFDPACGSGTFLLEAFEQMTKGDIRGGRGDYAQAAKALANIGGNDINPFSAVIAQIQTLWHLLPLKSELKKQGFPYIRIAGGINSVVTSGALHKGRDNDLYTDLNQSVHDVVVGNPPYIRPERSGDVDKETDIFYRDIGGAKKNYYDLFVYKALTHWCRTADAENRAGRMGFVLPLSFCDSGNSEKLRRLFALGGKFRLIEIVDMEAIAPLVFDAAVNPIVLLAENRPATAEDKITLRVAGDECVIDEREFDLNRAFASKFNYAEVFTADGRILTKLNTQRKRIIDKMKSGNNTLADIARVYWVGIGQRNRIMEWRERAPETELMSADDFPDSQNFRYEKKRMLGRGAVSRGKIEVALNNEGLDYYKGENINACAIEGEMAKKNILPDSLDDASFWRFRHILPNVGYAFLRITLGITAARFNPHKCAFFDTATLLFPNEQWENFPLDIALTSRLYQFYYACYLRECPVQKLWSNLYPRTIEKIPLPPTLLDNTKRLSELRESFLTLCEQINRRADTLITFLQEVNTDELKNICREQELNIKWSDGLQNGQAVKINAPMTDSIKIKNNRLLLEGEYLEIADTEVLRFVAVTLITQHGRELKKEDFQKMLVPSNANALADFEQKFHEYISGSYEDELESIWEEIDAIVGAAFGLSNKEINYIQQELKKDEFLSKISPKMPYIERRQRGLSDNLASSARYERNRS